ncbi:hypothetical protein [Actinoplanes sp. NPDC051851]|uniref:hypothetical protein n=1 Tax=Actinoplanes sp. NPDC051851 TaxID=3154753 RepID=UPI00343E8270
MTPGRFRYAWRLPHVDPLAYLDIAHFERLVVPILQKRGLFQQTYTAPTSRGRLFG